ncbi:MAG: restriction endonuclease subunit S [Prolixibacteraceae bacterium]|nr:restriction endonuclease subunit S [Prolixibacteraceae bacterium]
MEKQKNIPQLRFPEFKGDWENKTLGTLSDVRDGTHESPKYVEEGYPLVTSKNLTSDGQLDLSDITYISKEDFDAINKRSRVSINDILFGMIGTIGNPVQIKEEGFAIKNVALIKEKHALINKYLINYLNTDSIRKQFYKENTGGTQKFLALNVIRNLAISFPKLDEQQKIASFFTSIDQKISQLKRKKTLLEQYKKGVIQKIFSQGIRFKDDNGQEYPKWKKMTGDALFETVSNKNHNSDLPILAITQEHGAIPRDMIDYYITVSEQSVESYKVVEKGDFIISLRSFQGGIEYSEYTGICSPAYIILRATQRIDHRYFKYYFKTDKYITDLNRKLEGIRDGKMISYKYFSEIEINVPSLLEQTKISNFLSAIDDKITHTQNQIEKAEVWKKGLMQQMFV